MTRAMIWIGSSFAALGLVCCFTPILPILLGAAGMTGLLSVFYQDVVLLPIAGVGFAVAGLRLWRVRRVRLD